MSTTRGLIILESKNAILHELLQPRLLEGLVEPCEVTFSDFDDITYRVVSNDDGKVIKVNVGVRCYEQVKKQGTSAVIDRLFPGLEVRPDTGYDFAIEINLTKVANPAQLLKDVSEIKMNILGGPLDAAFSALASKKPVSQKVITLNYRPTETIYVCSSTSKVVVIFLVDFVDVTDKAVARIFLQQFVEAQRSIRTAPSVSFSREPPGELSSEKLEYSAECTGFLSFGLEERHILGDKKQVAIALLTGFRSYLHYHIKCSKTYLHMRMRKNVATWLQVLNRARPDIETEKKTMAGKTFVRK